MPNDTTGASSPIGVMPAPRDFTALIDGNLVTAAEREVIERRSPAHGTVVSRYPAATQADLREAIAAARREADLGTWRRMPGAERARIVARVARLIERQKEELGLIEFSRGRQTHLRGRARDRRLGRALGLRGDTGAPKRRRSLRPAWRRQPRPCLPRTRRRRRHDHALELSAPHRQPEAAIRACCRLLRGRQAE